MCQNSDAVAVIDDLLDKAQTEQKDTGHVVSSAAHSFAMLEPSLEDKLAQGNMALELPKSEKRNVATPLATV